MVEVQSRSVEGDFRCATCRIERRAVVRVRPGAGGGDGCLHLLLVSCCRAWFAAAMRFVHKAKQWTEMSPARHFGFTIISSNSASAVFSIPSLSTPRTGPVRWSLPVAAR